MKYVVGHRNPDTDSVVSAIVLADLLGKGYLPAVAGDVNRETVFVLNFFGVLLPESITNKNAHAYVLVDHNQEAQMSKMIDKEKIEAIVDHHNLGGLSLSKTISVRMEPVGSTGTIIAAMYKEINKEINKKTASLLLACIVSDTLNFKSPTTTILDKELSKELEILSGVDASILAADMFAAKSDLSGISINKLIEADYKEFKMGRKKVGIGVFETVNSVSVLDRKKEILEALETLKKNQEVEYLFFLIVDILEEKTYFILPTEKEEDVAFKIFKSTVKNKIMELPGLVSRKKQIVPSLENFF